MANKRDLVVKNLGQLVANKALEGRSDLYQWMHANYAQLLPILTRPRPPWTALAKTAWEAGEKASDGEPHSRQVMWKTWQQLHRNMSATVRPPTSRPPRPSIRSPDDPPSAHQPASKAGALANRPEPPDDFILPNVGRRK